MSNASTQSGRGESDAIVRRTRYTLRTLVLVIAVTAGVVFALILGQRWGTRLDLTATREHTLSPRTIGILASQTQPANIVVSADVSKVDPRSWERVTGMLSEFARIRSASGASVNIRTIDSGASGAGEQAAAVVAEIAARDAETVKKQRAVLTEVGETLATSPPALASLADQINTRADTITDAAAQEKARQLAAALRVAAKDAPDAAERVKAAASTTSDALPEADTAALAAGPLLLGTLKALDEAAALQPPIPGLSAARDRIAVANDALRSLRPLEALSIRRALAERPTVIVYNHRATSAIDFDTLFPRSAGSATTTSTAAPLFVGEELLSTAVASLNIDRRPILVLVHAERERMLDDSTRPTPTAANAIGKLLERLSLRRVDIAEWPVALDATRTVLTKLDPTGARPVVWFVLPAPARTSADPRRGGSIADRPQRVQRLADSLRTLLDTNANVLLALEPSEMPAVGEPDPLCEPLKAWGIKPDTSHPILERIGTPQGPAFSAYQNLRATETASPIGAALSGLSLILHWPMPIEIDQTPGVRAAPVYTVTRSPQVWGESNWLALRYANVRKPFQALMPAEMPGPDAGRDRIFTPGDTTSWPVVIAADRDPPARGPADISPPQRLVVVAAPGWFEDLYTQAAGTVDGRRVWAFPANAELFESSFHWLAGLDELIAPSPRIRDVPRIEPMTETKLATIRWLLIGGLPLLVLALGFAVRVLRG